MSWSSPWYVCNWPMNEPTLPRSLALFPALDWSYIYWKKSRSLGMRQSLCIYFWWHWKKDLHLQVLETITTTHPFLKHSVKTYEYTVKCWICLVMCSTEKHCYQSNQTISIMNNNSGTVRNGNQRSHNIVLCTSYLRHYTQLQHEKACITYRMME